MRKKHHLPKGILLVSPTLVVYRLGRLAKTVFFSSCSISETEQWRIENLGFKLYVRWVKCFFSLSVLCVISVRSGSRVFSSGSVKSDQSKSQGPDFSEKKTSSTKRYFVSFSNISSLSKVG